MIFMQAASVMTINNLTPIEESDSVLKSVNLTQFENP